MARAKRICPKPGCPKVAGKRYCPDHEREYEAKRGTPSQRGYGSQHQQLRSRWAQRIATGAVTCATCPEPIRPGEPWDLGHSDDRNTYIGPQHIRCNRSEGGKRGRATQG